MEWSESSKCVVDCIWVTKVISLCNLSKAKTLCFIYEQFQYFVQRFFNAAHEGLVCLSYLFKIHVVRSVCVFIHNRKNSCV